MARPDRLNEAEPHAARGKNKTLHFIAIVRDTGSPPLARYQRVRVQVQ